MAIFEVESWTVREGKEEEHKAAMRQWFEWVRSHRHFPSHPHRLLQR